MPKPAVATECAIDIHFSCSNCGQPLVVERAGAGTFIDCPNCSKAIQIPTLAELDPHVEELLETWRNHARNSARELKRTREHLTRAQKELRKREECLAEALDQLHAQTAAHYVTQESLKSAASKIDWLTSELSTKSEDIGRIREQLNISRTESENLQRAAKEHQNDLKLIARECEALKTERARLAVELEHASASQPVLKQEHAAALDLTRQQLTEVRAELAALQTENNAIKAEAAQLHTNLEQHSAAVVALQEQYQAALETIEHQTIELTLAKQHGIAQQELLGQTEMTQQQWRAEAEQARAERDKAEKQLQKLRTERAQFTLQDQQTLREMSKVREQLSLMQFERERVLEELKKTKERLKSTQAAREEMAVELAKFRTRSPSPASLVLMN